MHTYIKLPGKPDRWAVGITEARNNSEGSTNHDFRQIKNVGSETEAAAWASYLNGGARPQ